VLFLLTVFFFVFEKLKVNAARKERGVKFLMVITLVNDTFNINNNGTTISAMRFAEALFTTRPPNPHNYMR